MTSSLMREPSGRVNTFAEGDQGDSRLAMLVNHNYVIVWNSFEQDGSVWGIFGQMYSTDGTPLGGEFLINSTTYGNQQAPFIGALADGGFVVVWESQNQDGSSEGVYSQRFDASGGHVGNETLVNTTTFDHQEYADVAGLADGGYVVVWESYLQDPDGSSGIYSQRYDAGGTPVGGETRINSLTDNDQNFPAIAALGNGGYVVAWTSRTDDGHCQTYVRAFAANGDATGADLALGTASSETLTNPAIRGTSDGGFVVDWTEIDLTADKNDVYVQRFDSNGAALAGAVLVAVIQPPAGATEGGYYGHNSIAALDDNGYIVTYDKHDTAHADYGVYMQRFDSTGERLGGELAIQTYAGDFEFRPAVESLHGGGFVVSWDSYGEDGDGRGLRQQVFTASGGVTGAPYIYGTGGNDTNLTGSSADDHIYGGAGNDNILGGKGDDVLDGGSGNDRLDGGTGFDIMTGSAGDDTYLVGSGDTLIEAVGGGTDTVMTSLAQYSLGAEFENLILGGIGNSNGTGNGLNNAITGNDGNNMLLGGSGDDYLNGGTGNDWLDGGTGFDTMEGGAGDDTYLVGSGDTLIEAAGGGTDTVMTALAHYTLGAELENLILTGTADSSGTGNDLDNVLTGNNGNNVLLGGRGNDHLNGGGGDDWLDGGSGADVMIGGAGDDTYVLGNGDTIVEADDQGTDTVLSTLAYYHLGATLENVTLYGDRATDADGNNLDNVLTGNGRDNHLNGGNGNDTLYGMGGADTLQGWNGDDVLDSGSGDDTLLGGWGNDVLNGGDGHDVMIGGPGNDTYYFNDGDTISERYLDWENAGIDTVITTVVSTDWTFRYDIVGLIENVTLVGAALNVIGNVADNILIGDDLDNMLSGMSGNDTITGGDGNDTIIGGSGADILTGGAGDDVFVYTSADDGSYWGGAASNFTFVSDVITDLSDGDKIDLHLIDADIHTAGDQAFHQVDAFTGQAGEIVLTYNAETDMTTLKADIYGDGIAYAPMTILIQGNHSDSAGWIL